MTLSKPSEPWDILAAAMKATTDPSSLSKPSPPVDWFAANDPCGEDSPAYRFVFQSWVVMFLLVVCFALVNYLLSFIP